MKLINFFLLLILASNVNAIDSTDRFGKNNKDRYDFRQEKIISNLGEYDITINDDNIIFDSVYGKIDAPLHYKRDLNNFNFDGVYKIINDNKQSYYFRFGWIHYEDSKTIFSNIKWLRRILPKSGKYKLLSMDLKLGQHGSIAVCTIGDSQTWWNAAQNLRLFLNNNFPDLYFVGSRTDINGYPHEGEGGNNTREVLRRINYIPKADYYTLLLGTNDWQGNIDSAFKNINDICDILLNKCPQSKILYITPLPTTNTIRDQFNTRLKEMVVNNFTKRIEVVDVGGKMREDPNWQKEYLSKEDGLHESIEGIKLMAGIIADKIKSETNNLGTAYSMTYYVSNAGNDASNGISPSSSWKTLSRVSLILNKLKPGDKLLFKRGNIFNSTSNNSYKEILDIKSSGSSRNYITIGAYSSGPNPIINGQSPVFDWHIANNWSNTSGNIWKMSWSGNSSHRLWVNDVEYARCVNNTTPTAHEPFSTDGSNLYVYSHKGNPALVFSKMESTLGDPAIYVSNQSYLIIEDIDIRGCSGGIRLYGCSDIILRRDSIGYNCQGTGLLIRRTNHGSNNILVTNCTFNTDDHIFHSFEEKSTEDGIHVSDDSHNIEVSHCSFINWGHAAAYMLNGYHTKGYPITNVKFKTSYYTSPDINYGYGPCADILDFNSTGNEIDSNIIYKTGLALQIQCPYIKVYSNIIDGTYGHSWGSNPESSGITLSGYFAYAQNMQIYNNTIVNCSGYGIFFHNSGGNKKIQDNLIANNILYINKGEGPGNRENYSYVQFRSENDSTILNNTFKNNLLYARGVINIISYGHAPNQHNLISVKQFNLYNRIDGDVISGNIGGDPLFLSTTDLHLQSISPAINAGVQVGLPYNGNVPDIGAHETIISSSPGTDTVKAGTDQTIYLSQASEVMLDGSGSSGGFYAWTKIYDVQQPQAGYPIDPATITSPSSATTTITGLIQGGWYHQLAVTDGTTTKYDTTVVSVDYDLPPAGAIYIRGLPLTNQFLIDSTNSRYDTIHDIEGELTISEGSIFFNRSRLPDMMIDSSRGKFYSTVEDGYGWHGSGGSGTYGRAELHLQGSTWNNGMGLDSNKTYCFEWKGYFPQDFSKLKENQTAVGIMQIHAHDGYSPPFSFTILNGHDGRNTHVGTTGLKALYFTVTDPTEHSQYQYICDLSDMVDVTHTIRFPIREGKGYSGQDAFAKVEVDGIQKYCNNTGNIGRTWQEDYPKIATLYDYGNALVDASNHIRGRKFSLVTESFKIYEIK